MVLLMGSVAADPDGNLPENVAAYAVLVAHEVSARINSSKAALAWLQRSEAVARTYLIARLLCPRGKKMADLYCLPKSANYRGKSLFRLLVVPTRRGRVTALIGDAKKSRKPGTAWWYISDEDLWDLRCKCCPRADDGVRAHEFFAADAGRGFNAVLL